MLCMVLIEDIGTSVIVPKVELCVAVLTRCGTSSLVAKLFKKFLILSPQGLLH